YRTLDEELSEPRGEKKLLRSGAVAVPNGLRWTGSKRSLIELIYPLQKYVNNGQASIKEIVQGFQHLFNTDLNNYPRIYQEVLGRKKGETLFLKQLMNDMNDRSEENEKERLRKRGFK
ncbi:MAG TPA: RteC domain-containing protein, partial [Aquella sp.]|nr:RteC domain-containing protein [Aquella sp.]